MKRAAAIVLSVLTMLFCLSSCSRKESPPPTCRELLVAMTECEIGLPAGRIFCLTAQYGSEEYLPDSLLSSLFGNGNAPEICESWQDCALFFALNDHPCEFAVIRCKSRDSALDTAKLLSNHLASARLLKGNNEYFDKAKVTVIGNYALLIVSSDPDCAIKAVKALI